MVDPYASHLPVLRTLSKDMRMCRILEFGAGDHSTPFFLGLPGLETLVSIEADPEWREHIAREYANPRLDLRDADYTPQLRDFDLVFIDDGKCAAERLQTIRWVLSQRHPPVVIHDAEVPEYREAIAELSPYNVIRFDRLNPATALVWE